MLAYLVVSSPNQLLDKRIIFESCQTLYPMHRAVQPKKLRRGGRVWVMLFIRSSVSVGSLCRRCSEEMHGRTPSFFASVQSFPRSSCAGAIRSGFSPFGLAVRMLVNIVNVSGRGDIWKMAKSALRSPQ